MWEEQPGKVVLDLARACWMSPVPECTWNLVFVNTLRICGPHTCASSLLGSSHSRGWVEGGNADAPFLGQSGPLTLNTMLEAPLETLGLRFLALWSLSYSQVSLELYSELVLWYSELDSEICSSGWHYTQNWSHLTRIRVHFGEKANYGIFLTMLRWARPGPCSLVTELWSGTMLPFCSPYATTSENERPFLLSETPFLFEISLHFENIDSQQAFRIYWISVLNFTRNNFAGTECA